MGNVNELTAKVQELEAAVAAAGAKFERGTAARARFVEAQIAAHSDLDQAQKVRRDAVLAGDERAALAARAGIEKAAKALEDARADLALFEAELPKLEIAHCEASQQLEYAKRAVIEASEQAEAQEDVNRAHAALEKAQRRWGDCEGRAQAHAYRASVHADRVRELQRGAEQRAREAARGAVAS